MSEPHDPEPLPVIPAQSMLSYAPPERSNARIYWVVLAGLATTFASLGLVHCHASNLG